MSTNCMFPYIKYQQGKTSFDWGLDHGEEFKTAIGELTEIRRGLMLAKNPKLAKKLDELAMEQFNFSKKFAPNVTSEMEGIAKGAGLTISDLVILNNYTDF